MNAIEQEFLRQAEHNEMCDVWVAQWKMAKKRAPMMLDVISHVFPHFSLHNASHSESILNNIAIILGQEGVGKLSVVDLWFLLNAAYYHDCGMVVDREDKADLFSDGSSFVQYVREKQADASSPMHEYAQVLDIKDNKLYYAHNELTGQSYEAVRFLVADYIRKVHADRSAHRVEEEFVGTFPQGMIPQRIIALLAQICASHTKPRETVMELPFEQTSGLGTAPCHPRFIAFLLRIGDLLDVDNNRISDVLLHSLGSIPVDSKEYNEVNRSITALNISKRTIEISAECKTYRTAEMTNEWFKWLNEEIIFVSQHWHLVAPGPEFGMLPTIGKLEVKLIGYDTIDGKNRPVFQIDTGKAIEMIQGAGLYSSPASCMRELLQNAVDATHLRSFKEHPDRNTYQSFFDQLRNYPIKVAIEEKKVDKETFECSIEILDQGIGMSKPDLDYLFNTGSSSKNKEKKALMDAMEAFMRPSGIFGIGFQSVFLVADVVELRTRKLNSPESYQVVLNNPSGKEKGAILMKTLQDDSVPVGTLLRFKTRKQTLTDSTDSQARHDIFLTFDRFYKVLDFAKEGQQEDYSRFSGLVEEVFKFGERSSVPMELVYNGKSFPVPSQGALAYFDEAENIAVERARQQTVCYRNQPVKTPYYLSIPLLSFTVNLLCGDAREWLTLNRESLVDIREKEMDKPVYRAVARYLQGMKASASPELRSSISMTLDYLRGKVGELEGIVFDDEWKKMVLPFKDPDGTIQEITVGELFAEPWIRKGEIRDEGKRDYLEFERGGRTLRLTNSSWDSSVTLFGQVCRKLGDFYKSVYFDNGICIVGKDVRTVFYADDDQTKLLLLKKYKQYNSLARDYFPCNEKYRPLQVKRNGLYFYPIPINIPQLVCPYRRIFGKYQYDDAKELVYDVDEKVLDYVYAHRADPSVTREQIAASYEQFRAEFQPLLAQLK